MKNEFEYRGVYFYEGTPLTVCDKLIELNKSRERITLDYGDLNTGKSWGDTNDIHGYVGKSTGSKPILILVFNKRSFGGGAIMSDHILSIKSSKGDKLIYKHS